MALRRITIDIENANNESRQDLYDFTIKTSDDDDIVQENRTAAELVYAVLTQVNKSLSTL